MKLKLLIITIMSSCCFAYGFGETIKEPCDYIDTVNITSGQMDENGNIKFNGTIFPKETYAQYNYEIVNYAERKSVNQHTRGCICLIKPCIRLCCYKNPTNSIAIPCVSEDTFSVQNIDGNVQNVNLNDGNFGVVLGKPCLMMFLVDNQEHSDENWHLHKNGSIMIYNSYINHESYCIGGKNNGTVDLYKCFTENANQNHQMDQNLSFPIGMLISVPFLILTFLVYCIIPELRNILGKSLMCYVVGLLGFYISCLIIKLYFVHSISCKIVAYVSYLSLLTCFFWLNVMSYDTWSSLRRRNSSGGNGSKKTFRNYCLYGFGAPVLLTLLFVWIDNSSWISSSLQPHVGIEICWLSRNRLTEFLYLIMPISCINFINLTFYSLTAYWLCKVQRDGRKVKSGENQNHSHIKADTHRFFLYLRLFIIMGVTWSMESISWFFESFPSIFYITDLLNCLQGVIIFILFVCKRSVLNLLIKRCGCFKKSTTSQTVEYKVSTSSESRIDD